MATMMFSTSLYSARMESSVVSVPVPAIRGNAMGTMLADAEESPLKNCMPSIISMAIKKRMNEPAMAKSFTVMPMIFKMASPANKKTSMIIPETSVAFPLSIFPTLLFTSIKTGSEPMTSITANKIMAMVRISFKEKFMGRR